MTLRIDRTDIAGAEVTIHGKFLAGPFRHAPITGEYIFTLDLDAADFARRQRTILFVRHSDRHARQWKTDAAAAPLCVQRVGADHAGFRHSVAFQYGMSAARLKRSECFQLQRRGTGNEQAHVATSIAVEPLLRQQPGVESRYTHHDRRPREIAQHQMWVELPVP